MMRSGAAARRQRAVGPLFTADFTSQTPGALVTLPSGLLVSRASVATAQTSASTLVTGIPVDTACIDTDGAGQGLLIEESRTQAILTSENMAGSGWVVPTVGASGGSVTGGQTGPDGATNAWLEVLGIGGVGNNQANIACTSGGPTIVSIWARSTVNTTFKALFGQTNVAGSAWLAHASTPATWARYVLAAYTRASATGQIAVCDSRPNGTVNVAMTSAAENAFVDFPQVENGSFPTSCIISPSGATATRAGLRAFHPTATRFVSGGRLSLYLKFRPLGSSSQYSANMRLWSVDASNFAEINFSTRVLTVTVAGTAQAFGTALPTWAAGDVVEVYCAAGGSALATLGWAKINGVKTALGTTAAQGTVPSAGALDILCNGTASQFSARVQSITAYLPGADPT